jgi:drug/metabolite transporter (DMT)-like permease
MNYITLAILSAFVFALIIVLVKYISKYKVKDFNSFFFWTYIAGLPFIFLIPLTQGFHFEWSFIFPMIIHSLFLTGGQFLFSKGVYHVDASVIGPLFQLQSGFIVILASIFLREKYPTLIYVYLGVLLIGAMLVSVTDKTKIKGFLQTGVLYILAMQLLHAGANIAIGFALQYTSNWQALFYSFLFNSIIVSIYVFIKKAPITRDFHTVKWMILRAILLLIATGLLYKAFESNLTISASFGLLFSPLVFIISLFSVWISPGLLEQQSSKTYLIRAIGMLIILFGAWNVLSLR